MPSLSFFPEHLFSSLFPQMTKRKTFHNWNKIQSWYFLADSSLVRRTENIEIKMWKCWWRHFHNPFEGMDFFSPSSRFQTDRLIIPGPKCHTEWHALSKGLACDLNQKIVICLLYRSSKCSLVVSYRECHPVFVNIKLLGLALANHGTEDEKVLLVWSCKI